MNTTELHNLEGLSGVVEAPMVHSVDAAMAAIESHGVCVGPGYEGALFAWRGDDGVLRSRFMCHMAELSFEEHHDANSLRSWLEHWVPQMTEAAPAAE
ncbi:hypothetical protein [Natronospira bacteriovora]|uniref:Uncharacterized protein n=1 Tax=Natronospira bacteriovora TaxID=3069753 RepID=A0ABU0W735_9GAMM|nr:hypothetical protein [Natronospira sp. AB-CW4]MDQ2069280.1 hypothetical protein [Natronospira sp. AB-CW4]